MWRLRGPKRRQCKTAVNLRRLNLKWPPNFLMNQRINSEIVAIVLVDLLKICALPSSVSLDQYHSVGLSEGFFISRVLTHSNELIFFQRSC